MNKNFRLLFFAIINIFYALGAMSERDLLFFLNPKHSLQDRIQIIDDYAYGDINQETRVYWTVPTIYFNEVSVQEMRYPNPLIDYFFEKGALFTQKYDKRIFDYIVWRNCPSNEKNKGIEKKELLCRTVCLAQVCVDAKMKYCGIYDKLATFNALCWACVAINKQKSIHIKDIKIPKFVITQLITREYHVQKSDFKDIIDALKGKTMPLREGNRFITPYVWIKNNFDDVLSTEQSYNEHGIEIFNPQAWEENPLLLIKDIAKRLKNHN